MPTYYNRLQPLHQGREEVDFDQTADSKGSLSDSSIGTLFSGVGEIVQRGLVAADEQVQSWIRSDVEKDVDQLDKDLGVDLTADINADPETVAVPEGLTEAAGRIRGAKVAFDQGALDETTYYGRLHSMTRQLRARYPGYREQIDDIISDVMGSPTANALRNHLLSNRSTADSAADAEWKLNDTFIRNNGQYAAKTLLESYYESKTPQKQKEIILAIQNRKRLEEDNNSTKLAWETKQISAREAGEKIAGNYIRSEFSRLFEGQESQLHQRMMAMTSPDSEEGTAFSAKEQETLQLEFKVWERSLLDGLRTQLQDSTNGESIYDNMQAKDVEEILDKARARIKEVEALTTNKDTGALYYFNRLAKATVDSEETKFLLGTPGAARILGIMQATPEDIQLQVFRDLNGLQVYQQGVLFTMTDQIISGEIPTLTRAAQRAEQITGKPVDAKTWNVTLKTMRNIINSPNTPAETVKKFTEALYGAESFQFLEESSFSSGGFNSKLVAWDQLTTDATVEKLASAGPEELGKYQGWVIRSFSSLFKDDLASLTAANLEGESEITYDPKSATWNVKNPTFGDNAAQIGKFIAGYATVPGLVYQAATKTWIRAPELSLQRGAETAVARLNRYTPKLHKALKASGMSDENIATTMSQILKLNGVDVDPANKKSLPTQLHRALDPQLASPDDLGTPADSDSFKRGPSTPKTKSANTEAPEGLLDLIHSVETQKDGYNAIYKGKHSNLSSMSIKEVIELSKKNRDDRQAAGDKRASSAAGRYQIINKTLRNAAKQMGISEDTIFSEDVQDSIAVYLARQAGLDKFIEGKMSIEEFKPKMTHLWEGFKNHPDKLDAYLRRLQR